MKGEEYFVRIGRGILQNTTMTFTRGEFARASKNLSQTGGKPLETSYLADTNLEYWVSRAPKFEFKLIGLSCKTARMLCRLSR